MHPAGTTSALNNFSTGPEYAMPSEISYGSLCDLGDQSYTYGSIKHGAQSFRNSLLNWPPISKYVGDMFDKKRKEAWKNKK